VHIHIPSAAAVHLHFPDAAALQRNTIRVVTDARADAPTPGLASTAGAPPAAGEVWVGQGGRFICTLPELLGLPARHLVFADAEEESLPFGPYADIDGARSHHDGAANTKALIAAGAEYKAAHWAASQRADGHADFHLPSRFDLLMAYMCAPQLFKTSGYYWSSTQYSRYYAFVQYFENGDSLWGGKDNGHRVRACRVIPLTT
jgi:hypothetical protein